MKRITNEEHKKILLEMLDYFDKICKKNNINYSLIAGSLLGAVREKGIIPWDDDIDIVLTLENYSKLIKVLNKKNKGRFKLINHENNHSYYLPFDKMIDTKTIAIENGRREIQNYGVFLDIFCYHNVPNNKFLRKIHYHRLKFWESFVAGYSKTDLGTDKVFFKRIRKMLSEKMGIDFILKKYNKVLSCYDKKKTNYLIASWPTYRYENEIIEKKWISNYTKADFNGLNPMITSDYDYVLKKTYGDYMTPPSEKDRTGRHGIDLYWRDKNE